ncbi:MAG: hypothetical protein ACUVWV_03925 [Thermodesulfobacteriota bacterium]
MPPGISLEKAVQPEHMAIGLRAVERGYNLGEFFSGQGHVVIPALERKVIDAAEWSMPGIDVTMRFHQICKYLIIPGVHQPSSMNETLVYKKCWGKLPPDLQNIVSVTARDASLYTMMIGMKLNAPALKLFRDKGVNIITLSSYVQKKAKQLAEEVHTEMAAQSPFFAKVLASLNTFRKTCNAYQTAFAISFK